MAMPKKAKITSAVLLLAVAAGCVIYLNRPESSASTQSTDDAYVQADFTLVAPQVSGVIGKVLVEENQPVKAGDLLAAIDQPVELGSLERRIVPTGISIALPVGFEAQVRPRSGLAAKHGVTVANAPGTIDADYRGEVGVILVNLGKEPFRIERGMRIAQMVVARHARAAWREVESLDETARGAGGFGSTGVGAGVTAGSAKRA